MRGVKADDSCEDGGFEASKTTTVTRMATPIPVSGAWGGYHGGEGLANREPRTYVSIHMYIMYVQYGRRERERDRDRATHAQEGCASCASSVSKNWRQFCAPRAVVMMAESSATA